MTAQLSTIAQLSVVGYSVKRAGRNVCMYRGNDYRLVMPDGSQRRAIGARR